MDTDRNTDKTLRDVANSLTFLVIMAAAGVVLMVAFDAQEVMFGLGALLAAVALFAILLDVRGALAPVRIPMEVLQNLEPAPEPEPEENFSAPQPKKRHLKLVVNKFGGVR